MPSHDANSPTPAPDIDPIAYLGGPFICGECAIDMLMERRTATLTCMNGRCPLYRKEYWWPHISLTERVSE